MCLWMNIHQTYRLSANLDVIVQIAILTVSNYITVKFTQKVTKSPP